MKNIYTLNVLGELTNIKDAIRSPSDNYFCLQCNDELIVRKGKINRHHFSHKKCL
jgi:competence CoiA-like predicted nuclease